tara:strand:+ start:3007 stop:3399 length:393 start_codon:yes stop_codon:yes gene_type:complete
MTRKKNISEIDGIIRMNAIITRKQLGQILENEGELPPPPPPPLRRQRAIMSTPSYNRLSIAPSEHRYLMNNVRMELVRFMENKIILEENIAKKKANIAIMVIRQLEKIPVHTLPHLRKYIANVTPIKRMI